MKQIIIFTHVWVTGFGWENTAFQPEDFAVVELFGDRTKDGQIFIATNAMGGHHVLKGDKELIITNATS